MLLRLPRCQCQCIMMRPTFLRICAGLPKVSFSLNRNTCNEQIRNSITDEMKVGLFALATLDSFNT
jgi:hypothetical protein